MQGSSGEGSRITYPEWALEKAFKSAWHGGLKGAEASEAASALNPASAWQQVMANPPLPCHAAICC